VIQLPIITRITRKLATNISYIGKYFSEFDEIKLKNPVFLIGCGRSGTTMLLKNISSHSDIATFSSEANDLWHPKSYPWHYSNLEKPPPWVDPKRYSEMSLKDWTPRDIQNIKNIFGIFQSFTRKRLFLNKSAMITFYIPFLIKTFPNLRLIHIVRDGRPVALSYAKKMNQIIMKTPEPYKKKGYFFSFDKILDKCSETWKEHIFEIEKQKNELNLLERNILYELKYEDYCINPKRYLICIATFLNIDFNKFKITDYSGIKSMNTKYREELHDKDIERISQIMKPALEIKGYST
jgi:hypothetical protein